MEHKGTRTLQTQRLVLRKARMEDARPMLANWASDAQVTKFLTWPPHANLDVTKTVLAGWIENYERPDFYHWMIALKEQEAEPIGSISVVSMSDSVGKAEVGYCIGTAWWRRGIMTEALKAVIDYLVDEVEFQRIEAKHDPNNPHSGAVMRKCGMQYEGTTRRSQRNNQGICDTSIYGLLAEERGKD